MNRRDLLSAISMTGAAFAFPLSHLSAYSAAGQVQLHTEIKRLKLRHTWTTTMSSSDFRDTLHLGYTRDGITGYGEGAPIIRYHENALDAQRSVEAVREFLVNVNPWHFCRNCNDLFHKIEGQFAAKAAIDIAWMDWIGKKLGVPLYRYLGLDPKDAPVTTFSIGIDTPEVTKQKTREAEAFPILKIKVGLATDEPTIEAVRSVTNKPLRVDANEGWKDKEEAVRKINWLETQGVEFVEQPMPANMLDETRWVRGRVHIPILADEACLGASTVPRLANAYDGVNIKLDKMGGIQEAIRTIATARAFGLKTMLGCMVSTSVSVTAAAHLSPLVDYADLDGNLLIANDPFVGVQVQKGKLILPDGPGLGLTNATSLVSSGNASSIVYHK